MSKVRGLGRRLVAVVAALVLASAGSEARGEKPRPAAPSNASKVGAKVPAAHPAKGKPASAKTADGKRASAKTAEGTPSGAKAASAKAASAKHPDAKAASAKHPDAKASAKHPDAKASAKPTPAKHDEAAKGGPTRIAAHREGGSSRPKPGKAKKGARRDDAKLASKGRAEPSTGTPRAPAARDAGEGPRRAAEGKAAEGKATQGKAAEGKAAEGKAAEGKAAEGKAAEGKAADGKVVGRKDGGAKGGHDAGAKASRAARGAEDEDEVVEEPRRLPRTAAEVRALAAAYVLPREASTVEFDLDADGRPERFECSVARALSCRLFDAGGATVPGSEALKAAQRVEVLQDRTNGWSDLRLDGTRLLVWSGRRYAAPR